MKKIALIPARYAASRFPGKMMADLGGKTVIWRTYESALKTGLFDEVAVVCDHPIIYDEISAHGGKVIMSKREHECGTDRIAEAAEEMDADIIVNVQGDEPFTRREPLEKLLQVFEGAEGKKVQVASLMQVLNDAASIADPNYVKVAVDLHFNALFFSRSPIPYHRNQDLQPIYYEHIGVYAFRKQTLMDFTKLPPSPLERAEKIECLRYLENGIPMKMVVTDYMGVEIDTPEDLVKAAKLL
ncbi:MAG: 3-deoxy-manno-octulosonate cytidylyltransferase [Bacteroidetes bacterium]|nr:3-deoxy-manno-octulosonate cytidylyltransferase [Bacteroidota bacterium]HOA38513.1 3-deoxy-manno-octulosonate cytidylyltransferase [Flavihumibacter sp.]